MEMPKNAISWVEIPVLDFDKAKKFYSEIFDYEMPEMPMNQFRMGFLLSERDGISGAIIQGDGYKPTAEGALVYLNGGKDLQVVLDRIPTAGGAVLTGKTLISPEMGFFAWFTDCEGNRMGLHSLS